MRDRMACCRTKYAATQQQSLAAVNCMHVVKQNNYLYYLCSTGSWAETRLPAYGTLSD